MSPEQLKETGLALIALSEGKEVEVFFGKWGSFTGSVDGISGNISCLWRIKPSPKMRPIRKDELPFVFVVRDSDNDMHLVSVQREFFNGNVTPSDYALRHYEYSMDGKTWHKFEKEDV